MQADSGIYIIRCVPTGKVYVGSSLHIRVRWAEHRSALTRGSHHNAALTDDWKRYGPSAFEFTLLEAVGPPPADALAKAERRHIQRLNASDPAFGYNVGGTSRSDPDAEPADLEMLSDRSTALAEGIGALSQKFSLSRIGGRLLSLLIVADRELSLDDLTRILRVSRASVSIYIRLAMVTGFAELVTHLGDRRDYYRFASNAWEQALLADIEGTVAFRRMAERGLEAAHSSQDTATERLTSMIAFCDVALEDRYATLKRWRENHPRK